MKRVLVFIISFVLVLGSIFATMLLTANATNINLISNGDFETATGFTGAYPNQIPGKTSSGFDFSKWFRATQGNTVAYDAIIDDGTGNHIGQVAHNIFHGVAIESNKSYTISFRVKSSVTTAFALSLTDSSNTDADSTVPTFASYVSSTNSTPIIINSNRASFPISTNWITYTATFSVGTLNSAVSYAIRGIGSPYDTANPTYYFLDDFSLTELVVPDQYKTIVSAENGTAYVSNAGLVPTGTTVNVTADANKGYQFDGWYEGAVKVSSTVNYSFDSTANRTLVAKFIPTAASAYDVDSDGYVNDNDAVAIQKHIVGKVILTGAALLKADVNKDGKVSVSDIVLLRKNFDGSTPQNLTSTALKTAVLGGTYQKMLDDSIDNQGNMVRIANAMRKAQSGQPVVIGFIGGSITEGARASTADKRYVNQVKDWWVSSFPQSSVTFVNAGIGSTSSLLGVHRVVDDLLSKNPDFVVVDFTTNDDGSDSHFQVSYEDLIRRILEYRTNPGVLAVFFGATDSTKYTQGIYERKMNSESNHKPSGLFYDIPIINYIDVAWQYINAGVITWPEIAGDYIHPNDNGHKMAASCINNYLSKVLAKISNIGTTAPALPSNFFFGSDIYMNATLLDNDNLTPSVKTNFNVINYQNRWNSWQCTSATGELTFTLNNCKAFSIMREYVAGGGSFDVYINGVKRDTISCNTTGSTVNWLGNTYQYDHAQTLVVDLKSTGTVTITSILYTDGTHPVTTN